VAEGVPAAAPAALGRTQRRQIDTLLRMLEKDPLAPTTIRDRGEAQRMHVADSLVALELEALSAAGQIADLGSGAGFPGLAIAVARSAAEVHLIESQRRRCEFLLRAREAAGLENVSVVCTRAEEWLEGRLRNDAVLARALAAQAVVLEYAAPLLRLGGSLIDWRGRRDEAQEEQADRAAAELGMRRVEVRRVEPFAGARDRHLHVFVKSGETPSRFPRRAGAAAKSPLGALAGRSTGIPRPR
jgi:16S rRNA (guanine527-N7)-methyltransferase